MEQVTMFKAKDGSLHDDERSALVADLAFQLTPFAENEPIARKMAEKIADDPCDLGLTLKALCDRQARLPLGAL